MQRLPDLQQYSLAISAPLSIPKTQFDNPLSNKKLFALRIVLALFRQTVMKTVQFD